MTFRSSLREWAGAYSTGNFSVGGSNIGNRAAQLDASIRAGRLHLSAYSMGFGAAGLTFFDDGGIQFFSPHSAGKSVMFPTLPGAPQKRTRVAGG